MKYKYNRIVIGIDPSYKRTGISIAVDGRLRLVKSITLPPTLTKSDKRLIVANEVRTAIDSTIEKADDIEIVIERIRLRSGPVLSINYIKSISALIATIVDTAYGYGIKVHSVDTRCWKSQVVGTSKPEPNEYGVDPKKWPTIKWLINQGFEQSILITVDGRKKKQTFVSNGVRYEYDDDAADSAAISMFGFVGDRSKLQLEE